MNKDLDAGPIVLQQSVPVLPGDTADTLAARILEVEHQLYPDAIEKVLDENGLAARLTAQIFLESLRGHVSPNDQGCGDPVGCHRSSNS